jgi:hypothetical protein
LLEEIAELLVIVLVKLGLGKLIQELCMGSFTWFMVIQVGEVRGAICLPAVTVIVTLLPILIFLVVRPSVMISVVRHPVDFLWIFASENVSYLKS